MLGSLSSYYWNDNISFINRDEFGARIREATAYSHQSAHWYRELKQDEYRRIRLIERGTMIHPKGFLFGKAKRHIYIYDGITPQADR